MLKNSDKRHKNFGMLQLGLDNEFVGNKKPNT